MLPPFGFHGGEVAVTAPAVEAFGTRRFDPTGLPGWPAGATVVAVARQGTRGRAFLRRAHRTASDVGQIDYFAGATQGADRFKLATTAGEVAVEMAVTRTVSATATVTTAAALHTALAGAASGDVIVLRAPATGSAQVYDPRSQGGFNSAEPAGGFTVLADPDDVAAGRYPLLWLGGDDLHPFWFAPAGAWTLHDAASNTWKSTLAVTDPASIFSMAGMYRNAHGDWQRLYYYQEAAGHLAQLTSTADTQIASEDNDSRYSGPGFVLDHSTGELYVRLEPPSPQQVHGAHFYDYSHRYPPASDPNQVPLLFALTEQGGSASQRVINFKRTRDVVFENIWCIGGAGSIHAGDSVGLTVRGCTLLGQCQADVGDDGNVSYSLHALAADGTTESLLVDQCVIPAGVPPWVAWGETKGYQGAYGLSMRGVMIGSGGGDMSTPLEIRNSWIQGWFNLHAGDAKPQFRVHHNHVELCHGDGMLLQSIDLPECHFSHNLLFDANIHGYDGGGDADYAEREPPFFEGHNLVVRLVPLGSRNGWWSGNATPNRCSIRQIDVKHGEIGPWAKPLARYHCTMVCGAGTSPDSRDVANCNQFGRSWDDAGGTDNDPNGNVNGSANDRFYNNIACVFPSGYGTTWTELAVTTNSVAANFRSAHGDINYESDGQHVFRDGGAESNPAGGDPDVPIAVITKAYDQSHVIDYYPTMAALRAAGHGIEDGGSDGDPLFAGIGGAGTGTIGHGRAGGNEPYEPAAFCLASGSPCATGAVEIAGRSWHPSHGVPWYDGYALSAQPHLAYRGCMDPALPALEQPIGPLIPRA